MAFPISAARIRVWSLYSPFHQRSGRSSPRSFLSSATSAWDYSSDSTASSFKRSRKPTTDSLRRLAAPRVVCGCLDGPDSYLRPFGRFARRSYSALDSAREAAPVKREEVSGVLSTKLDPAAGRRRIAIIGAGPSGCYAAKYLQSGLLKHRVPCSIDVIDQQCVLGGLVRYGVAPDHPEVKNVLNDFEALFENRSTSGGSFSRIQFYGGVKVGRDVQLDELRSMYDAVVLAYGCESSQTINLPGERELRGVISAREFVAWYNGHPEFHHIGEQVKSALNDLEDANGRASMSDIHPASVVVIGHGNVALDCARILAKGADQLYDTDLAKHALPVLRGGVSSITIVGRRGHVQAAFTIKEVRELVNLSKEGSSGAVFSVDTEELDSGMTEASGIELSESRPRQRIDKLLRDHASARGSLEPASSTIGTDSKKRVQLRFLLNPVRFETEGGNAADQSARRLGKVVCERTRLEGEPGRQRAVGTGVFEALPAQMAIVSVGYRGTPIPGLAPFFNDNRGTVENDQGRVDPARVAGDDPISAPGLFSSRLGGLYVTGWLKRGPSGIIGTNISDAKETVAAVVSDLIEEESPSSTPADEERESLSAVLQSRGVTFVDWDGYQKIVQKEFEERRSDLQPREKITSYQRQLEIANS